MADYYSTLGVARSADEKVLKGAYRKLAMKYHPDRNPDNAEAEQKFKEINEAYETLKDPQKKAAYDRYGHDSYTQQAQNGGGGRGGAGGGFDFSDIFDEVFGDFMGGRGGGRGQQGGQRGSDLRYNLEITLEDAFAGKQASIRIPTLVECETCDGSGAAKGTSKTTCTTCGGHGTVRAQQGFFTVERTCPDCNGTGAIIEKPCGDCHGRGRLHKDRSLDVNIPAGVEDGTRIRLSGEGEAGLQGAPAGDLYIFITVKPHDFFQRDGANLYCSAPVSMVAAALGDSFEVPSVDGEKLKVTVPEGTQSNKRMRLRGKGMPVLRSSSKGDLYVEVLVETPVNLSKKQKDLLRQFAEEGKGSKNSPQAAGFVDKIKGFWEELTG